MAPSGDLINKGFIVNRRTAEKGCTFIVTGLERSGTSLVAAMLRHAGIFLGSEINDVVFEDEAIARTLDARDIAALRQIIAERNTTHPVWGFKYPSLCHVLGASQLTLFERPRVIITFRDLVSMSVRASLSEYREPMRTLAEVAAGQAAMLGFVSELPCPSLLLSYEKALVLPEDFVDAIVRFCDLPQSAELRRDLCGLIDANSRRYIAVARRRFEGVIEGVRHGQLYGWCRLTHSADPVTLDVLVDDRAAMRVVAETFRQDLLDAGIGQGRHGFFIELAALDARAHSVIRIVVAPHGIELDNSGTRLCDFGTAA